MNTISAFRALVSQQWKYQRVEVTAFSIAAAAACPVCMWLQPHLDSAQRAWLLIESGMFIAVVGSSVAFVTGVVLAIRPYVLDAQTKHTYALSLPVPRSRYALLRVAAGMSLAMVPVVAFLMGALVAAQTMPPNTVIHAYPVQISIRFLLACALAFAMAFGVQYGLGQRATRWIIIAVLTIVSMEIVGQLALHVSLTGPFWALLAHNGSPLRIFLSSWTLFNV